MSDMEPVQQDFLSQIQAEEMIITSLSTHHWQAERIEGSGKANETQIVAQQLAERRENLAVLKRAYNENMLIFRIPNELLTEISLHFVNQAISSHSCRQLGAEHLCFEPFAWIRIGHVCHRWREVVLASPAVWSDFVLSRNNEYTLEMLSRSKAVPFGIWVREDCTICELQAVFEHISRLHRLDFVLDGFNTQNLVFPRAAPSLQSLTLRRPVAHGAFDTFGLSILRQTAIEEAITGLVNCDMPSLTRMSIIGPFYGIPWTTQLFPSTLTELVLNSVYVDLRHQASVSCDKLLEVLAALPLLERLQLDHLLCYDYNPQPPSFLPSASLEKLVSLQLTDSLWACNMFLQHIAFPPTTRIHLECVDCAYPEIEDLCQSINVRFSQSSGMDPLSSYPSPLTAAFFAECHGKSQALHTTKFVCWEKFFPVAEVTGFQDIQAPPGAEPLLTIRLLMESTFILFQTLFTLLPMSKVQSLSIIPTMMPTDPRVPESLWRESCESMLDLRDLLVAQWGHYSLADALCMSDASTEEEPGRGNTPTDVRQPVLFPRLESLTLLDTNWYIPCDLEEASQAEHPLRTLYDALRTRICAGRKLRCLTIQACSPVHASDIELLREVVEDVKWDEQEVCSSALDDAFE